MWSRLGGTQSAAWLTLGFVLSCATREPSAPATPTTTPPSPRGTAPVATWAADPADDPLPPSSRDAPPSVSAAPAKRASSGSWSETGEVPASEVERRAALDALAAGSPSGMELVEEATDPGVPTDPRLVDKLAPLSYVERPASRRPATVRVDVAQIVGAVPKNDVLHVALQNDGAYEQCYREGLAHNPKLRGRAVIDVTVDVKGEVIAAKARPGFPHPGTAECIAQAVGEIDFDDAEGVVRFLLLVDLVPT